EEEFLVGDEVDLVTDDFGFTPGVRVAPAVEVFAVEEGLPRRLGGGSGDEGGAEEGEGDERADEGFDGGNGLEETGDAGSGSRARPRKISD
ncbi:MAG: hypothetical protein NTZ29_15130, partial [Verrucomicrobia bacterium]|nr:hypothetical protein [Verrucomicrobiota bacterium]